MDGTKIKRIRMSQMVTQTELAKRIGSNRSYINQIENNRAKPSISYLERVADALGCSIKDFF